MMLALKDGIDIRGLSPEMAFALSIIAFVLHELGHHCVVTSALDGKHMRMSLHYAGKALDIRSPSYYKGGQPEDEQAGMELKKALGAQFDVIVEGYAPRPDGTVPPKHIHIEFDPKEGVA